MTLTVAAILTTLQAFAQIAANFWLAIVVTLAWGLALRGGVK